MNEKTGKFDEKKQKAPTMIENEEKKWREKEQLALKMIKEEEER